MEIFCLGYLGIGSGGKERNKRCFNAALINFRAENFFRKMGPIWGGEYM